MNPMHHIRRLIGLMAALAGGVLVLAAAAPAAFAVAVPAMSDGNPPRPAGLVHKMVAVGTPGWQITLIAIGAATAGAAGAVLLDRARAARRHVTAPSS